MPMSESSLKKFHGNFTTGGPGECWPWRGRLSSSGLPVFMFPVAEGGGQIGANRIMYELSCGEAPPRGVYVKASCNNKICLNPKHFYLARQPDGKPGEYDPSESAKKPVAKKAPVAARVTSAQPVRAHTLPTALPSDLALALTQLDRLNAGHARALDDEIKKTELRLETLRAVRTLAFLPSRVAPPTVVAVPKFPAKKPAPVKAIATPNPSALTRRLAHFLSEKESASIGLLARAMKAKESAVAFALNSPFFAVDGILARLSDAGTAAVLGGKL